MQVFKVCERVSAPLRRRLINDQQPLFQSPDLVALILGSLRRLQLVLNSSLDDLIQLQCALLRQSHESIRLRDQLPKEQIGVVGLSLLD